MGLPATPPMPNDGDLLACRTNADHFARLAFGVIPCDKYNHSGGEGCFRITARTLSSWPPSPPTESQIHLEEKSHLPPPRIRNLRLAGKQVTTRAQAISLIFSNACRFQAPVPRFSHASMDLMETLCTIPVARPRSGGAPRPIPPFLLPICWALFVRFECPARAPVDDPWIP